MKTRDLISGIAYIVLLLTYVFIENGIDTKTFLFMWLFWFAGYSKDIWGEIKINTKSTNE